MSSRILRFDNFKPSSEKSSKIASKIKSTNTKAEILLRKIIWKLGFRFRKNVKNLPGKPDIVFPKERVAVFCDGNFWHGKDWEERKQKLEKGANAPYWLSKIAGNMERDKRHNEELKVLEWTVLRFWESDILVNPNLIAIEITSMVISKRKKI